MKKTRICLYMQGNHQWVGGIEYTKNMVLALSALPPEDRSCFDLSLLSIRSIDRCLYEQVVSLADQLFFTDSLPAPSLFHRGYRIIDRVLSGNNDYRYHTFFKDQQFDFIYPFFFNRPLYAPYRYAGWIPDFQHKHLPHLFSKDEIEKRNAQFTQIAANSPMVVLSSRSAQSDFQRFFPQYMHKAIVLSFATYPDPSWYAPNPSETQKKYSLPDSFFIACNQFWKHKNHMTLFEALHLLKGQDLSPSLVCTGSVDDHRDEGYMTYLQHMIQDFGLKDQIHILGLIPRIDQIQLVRRSLAVVQPSLFEGWSTVIEDARCMGKHIIASAIPVHKEQNPPHCLFFQPESPRELAGYLGEWWEKLSPGPDPNEEAKARQSALEAVRAYGRRILDLAEE